MQALISGSIIGDDSTKDEGYKLDAGKTLC